jgi:hypothetical protein
MDGDPFDVAERATKQAAAIARLLVQTAQGAFIMARNAEMERQIMNGDDPDAVGFEDTSQGRRFNAVRESAQEAERSLNALALAAGYNPKKPLGAG